MSAALHYDLKIIYVIFHYFSSIRGKEAFEVKLLIFIIKGDFNFYTIFQYINIYKR
jgi:hypothetical protein